MNIKKILYIIFGCISFGLGAVGAVLPVLPTFPFLIFAAFCFARSSKKLDKWFKGTKLYKNNLEDQKILFLYGIPSHVKKICKLKLVICLL